jgi:FtsZ-binding cell division protein ZapB
LKIQKQVGDLMADGSVVIETKIDDKKAQEKLTKLNQKIERIKSNLAESESNKNVIESQLNESKKAALSAEKSIEKYTEYLKESTAATGGNDPFSAQWARRLEESKKELAEQDKITQKLDAKYSSIVDKVAIQKAELNAAKEKAADLQKQVAGAQKSAQALAPTTKALSPAAEKAEKSFNKLVGRIKGLAKRVFIFTIITAALRKIKQYMWSAIQTNDDAMNAVARLKGELRTLAQPIVNIAIPAFTALAKIITYTLTGASRLLSLLFGSTYSASKKAAKSLNDQQNAIEGVGNAAKKASKYLAPFDELNTISGNDAGGGSESGGNAVNFDSDIGSGVNAVMALMTGIALLAIGAILAFSGHVGVGIAMMVAGALTVYGVYASDGGEAAKTLVETGLSKILIAIGPMIAILGVVLMMTGNIPWGLGLLIAGIALFAVGEVAENWDLLSTNLVGALANMLIDISPYIALFGAVLLFVPGQQALGIGLIIAGIALFAVGEVGANWELLGTNLTSALTKIFSEISPYIVVFGLLLAMVPGMMALGIGMIIAGVAMFAVSAIAPNWDSITQALRGPLGKTLAMIGGFLVVLGLMLIFSGVGIPLGIGMLLAGGVSLAAAIAPNWNFIIDKIKYVWQKIKEFWNSYIAPVFTAAWWQNLGKNIMNGLISGIERGINWVLGGVSDMVNGITGILNKIPGVNIGRVNWGNVHIPRLAKGAVIPANREFLAVLGDQKRGTNIEAPADLIRQIVREEVKNSGGGGNHITIVLDSVNGKKLFDAIVKENNAVVRATGASPLVV